MMMSMMRTILCLLLAVPAILYLPGCNPSGEEAGGGGNASLQSSGSSTGSPTSEAQRALSDGVEERVKAGLPRLKAGVPQGKPGDPVTKPGSRTLASGLVYAVLQEGQGETPLPNAQVKVYITGWLKRGTILGRQFWNSRDDRVPHEYQLSENDLIEGLLVLLQTMKRGERRWVIVPSKLGYGEKGIPDGTVPSGSDLVFDIELVDFTPSA